MCFICDGSPVPEDPLRAHPRAWETSMMGSCCGNPWGFLASCICPCLMACWLRYAALQRDMSKYRCCQGYICGGCFKWFDNCAQSCPCCCLFCEVTLCCPCAVSSNRWFVQHERQIRSDPCDNRIIRLNNCLQCLACLCRCFLRTSWPAHIIRFIADLFYIWVQACMQAQTDYELFLHPTPKDYVATAAVVTTQPK